VSRVYSTQLGRASGLGGGGSTPLFGPAVGYTWVLRHIVARYNGVFFGPLQGFELTLGDGTPIWAIFGAPIVRSVTYNWSGRLVLNGGSDTLTFESPDLAAPGWSLFVAGYELLNP
jgi:hypothetical protein